MSFTVVTDVKDVNKAYLKASLEYQYRGKGYNYSDDLLTILESDFKRKAQNLDWLFKGKTRIHTQPTAERIFKSLEDDTIATTLITLAKTFGYGVEPESFVAGHIVIDKQPVRLAKAKEHIFSADNLSKANLLPSDMFKRYTEQSVEGRLNKYLPDVPKMTRKETLQNIGGVYTTTHNLNVYVHGGDCIKLRWRNTGEIDVSHIINLMNSTEVILSIDINDYITCSEGSFSSCMSEKSSSSRHLGWMMHFRSDFSVMTFTHKKGDDFYKTGRTWTFLKLTEDCLPFSRPFYKLSRIYGELNGGHITMVDDYIQAKISSELGLGKPKKHIDHSKAGFTNLKYVASPNMQNTTGNASGTGYFDWPSSDRSTNWNTLPLWEYKGEFPVVPFDQSNYQAGPVCLFNFPDALDINGAPTNESRFTNTPQHHSNAHIGWNERYKQFVTCSATGKRILLRDSLRLPDGSYISNDIAVSIIAGKPIEAVVVQEETSTPETPTPSTEEIDVTDF